MLPKQIGRYEALEEIARGAYGIVYRARDLELGRIVALKQMRDEEVSAESTARFFREARTAARLTHPHIVRVFDLGEHEGRPHFAMELVDGVPLTAKIYFDPPEAAEIARLMEKVARAVHFAHEHGVIHRDLKPGNILVRPDGDPAITDFGVARDLNRRTALTQAGELLGTPSYMAPEQLSGRPVDARSDIYALGVILYEHLARRTPFTASSFAELSVKVLHDPPEPPSRTNPLVDPGLEQICLRCLDKDPERRYASAADLADDLRRVIRNETVTVPSPVEPPSLRRHLGWVGLLGALVLGAFTTAGRSSPPQRQRVDTDPMAASVYVDNRFVGLSPVWVEADWVEARFPGRPSIVSRPGRVILPPFQAEGMAAIGRWWADDDEVTQEEYARFVEATGARAPWKSPAKSRLKDPVAGVTWDEATAYAAWVGKRLPTIEEWREIADSGALLMTGGVQEWTADGEGEFRGLCGGSDWMPEAERVAKKMEWRPRTARLGDAGFRCVRDLPIR